MGRGVLCPAVRPIPPHPRVTVLLGGRDAQTGRGALSDYSTSNNGTGVGTTSHKLPLGTF